MFLGEALIGEPVGIRPVSNRYPVIYFAPHAIALVDELEDRVETRLDRLDREAR